MSSTSVTKKRKGYSSNNGTRKTSHKISRLLKHMYNWNKMVDLLGVSVILGAKEENTQLLGQLSDADNNFIQFAENLKTFMNEEQSSFGDKLSYDGIFAAISFLALIYNNKAVYRIINNWYGKTIVTDQNILELIQVITKKPLHKRRSHSARYRATVGGGDDYLLIEPNAALMSGGVDTLVRLKQKRNILLSPMGLFCIMSIVTFFRVYVFVKFTSTFYNGVINSEATKTLLSHGKILKTCKSDILDLPKEELSVMKLIYATMPMNTLIPPELFASIFQIKQCYETYFTNLELQRELMYDTGVESAAEAAANATATATNQTSPHYNITNALVIYKNIENESKQFTTKIINQSKDLILPTSITSSALVPESFYKTVESSVFVFVENDIKERINKINDKMAVSIANINDPQMLVQKLKQMKQMSKEDFATEFAGAEESQKIMDKFNTNSISMTDVKNIFSFMMGGKTITDFITYWVVGLDITSELYTQFQNRMDNIIYELEHRLLQSKRKAQVIVNETKVLINHMKTFFNVIFKLYAILLAYIGTIINLLRSLRRKKPEAIEDGDIEIEANSRVLELLDGEHPSSSESRRRRRRGSRSRSRSSSSSAAAAAVVPVAEVVPVSAVSRNRRSRRNRVVRERDS